MKITNKILAVMMIIAFLFTMAACSNPSSPNSGNSSGKTITIHIAYQYGLAYAPLIICQNDKLIEKAYKAATGNDVEVKWDQMSSGADINTGIASGNINVGFMGIAPAITGISKNVGYKIFTNLSGQEHGLMTNDPAIKDLGDIIGSSKQIALVNTGSIQHIILGLALDANGYDAHALDSNIVAMKHPDGMTALESKNLACHLTSSPYIYRERDNSELHELAEVKDIWSVDKTFIVGVASIALVNDNPELYKAICEAVSSAINYINNDTESAAKATCEYNGNTYEDELAYLQLGHYSTETTGIFELAKFMYKNGFTDTEFKDYNELVFENVVGD